MDPRKIAVQVRRLCCPPPLWTAWAAQRRARRTGQSAYAHGTDWHVGPGRRVGNLARRITSAGCRRRGMRPPG